ncbi:response regulator [Micromonospora sp. NPDC003776]
MIDVLVVDDDFMVARIHRGFVERIGGFRVVGTASTGEQAVAAVDQLRPDLVLLDLYLPDMFGLDVVTRIRAARHDCDVLVISAAREAEAVRRAVRYGAARRPFRGAPTGSRPRPAAADRKSVNT